MEILPTNTTLYQCSTSHMIESDSDLTRFGINGTIERLASEMFIESWLTSIVYERFFNSCAPIYCSYKIYYHFDVMELLTTFLVVYMLVYLLESTVWFHI